MNRPHHLEPKKETARVILAVKNFAAIKGVCHIGLGVTATNTMKVLRREGYFVEAWPIQKTFELHDRLKADEAKHPAVPISHVIVSAPWINATRFKQFCLDFPNVEFVLLNHSGCAFLSIDTDGIKTNQECMQLQLHVHNFKVAANNTRVANWLSRGLGGDCLLIPNLYDTQTFVNPYPHRMPGDTIRIGSFGAGRPWKNQLTAAEAAIQLARQLGVNLEFYVNSKRPDGGEKMISERDKMFAGLTGAKLIYVPWKPWAQFRHVCANMHLLLQPSFDETFNVVTADGIAEGVPSVTASSIEWTPQNWWATCEDPATLVKVGLHLLHDKTAVQDGRDALTTYVGHALNRWKDYLGR